MMIFLCYLLDPILLQNFRSILLILMLNVCHFFFMGKYSLIDSGRLGT